MTIKELVEDQKRGIDGDFRRRVVSAYELGFITIEHSPLRTVLNGLFID